MALPAWGFAVLRMAYQNHFEGVGDASAWATRASLASLRSPGSGFMSMPAGYKQHPSALGIVCGGLYLPMYGISLVFASSLGKGQASCRRLSELDSQQFQMHGCLCINALYNCPYS